MSTPNPFSGLLHSRKFWLAILDAVTGLLALWLGALASEKTATLVIATWGGLQPVFIAVIAGIAYEDKAKLQAASQDKETAALIASDALRRVEADVALSKAECADVADEHAAELTEAYEAGIASRQP